MGVFYQPWRVHAFDLQKAAASVPHAVAQAAPQPLANTPKVAAPTLTPVTPNRWSDGDVVSALSSFYQSIIACLGLLLALVGVLAVVTLRFLSKAAAEDMAHESAKAAMQHYLDTRQFYEVVEYAVQETDIAKQLEQLAVEKKAITKQLEQLTGELQVVNQRLKEQQEQMSNNAPPGNLPPSHDDNEDVEGEVAPATAPAPGSQGGGN
ncbi:hypothetical protein [Metallibacterium scheffleri]